LFFYAGVPFIYGRVARIFLRRKAIGSKSLILTFDDGPGERLTPDILKILKEHKAKGNFFLLGRNIPGREMIVKNIAEQGHEICSHSYDHLHQLKVSPFRAIRDIKLGWQAIDNALGVQRGIYPFRPPYGKLNLISLLYLLVKRVSIVYWTADSGDTWDVEEYDAHRASELTKKDGASVVLVHDFDRSTDKNDHCVIESLQLLLRASKELKLQVCTVSQLIGLKK
jgi:peptidoglycan/xylan/chitin deacetylase (PgdA/CDA1 family)